MPDWVQSDDNGTFAAGFHDHLPPDLQDYAKGFKTLSAALKAGLEARREFRKRVTIPEDPEERGKFLGQHFKDELKAHAEKVKTETTEAAQAAAAQTAQAKLDADAQGLRAREGENFDKHLELARRAFRSEAIPADLKARVAQAADVEPDKLTDDLLLPIIARDPLLYDWLLSVGKLLQDGKPEPGKGAVSGNGEPGEGEQEPLQPTMPELAAGYADGHPVKQWFVNRGHRYEKGRYMGLQGAAPGR